MLSVSLEGAERCGDGLTCPLLGIVVPPMEVGCTPQLLPALAAGTQLPARSHWTPEAPEPCERSTQISLTKLLLVGAREFEHKLS